MELEYHADHGLGYVYFFPDKKDVDGICVKSVEVYPGIVVDFMEDGTPFGVEIYSTVNLKTISAERWVELAHGMKLLPKP